MKPNFCCFTFVSLFFAVFSSSIFFEGAKADELKFDRQTCIQGLEKEGLTNDKASIWCNFKEECIERSLGEGLPLEAAESVCNCSISEFRKTYTPQKFKELTTQEKSNPEVAEKLRDVGEMCFEEILFED